MEVFAGFLSHTDHHIGRVLDFLKETGEFTPGPGRYMGD
jgi:arylsulfatase A-like enzyme